jgi:hypothetical protein
MTKTFERGGRTMVMNHREMIPAQAAAALQECTTSVLSLSHDYMEI